MAAPALTFTGGRLYEALAPLARDQDASLGYPLALYLSGVARLLDGAADVSRDLEDETPGYAVLFDPDRVGAAWLAWSAQFVGVTMPPNLTEEAQRLRLRETDGFKRGSPSAIAGAARQFLTGTGTVFLTERHGSAYLLTVATITSETPDPAATANAIGGQVPAGIVWEHVVVTGGTFDTLRDTHASFTVVTATFATFNDARADPAHV